MKYCSQLPQQDGLILNFTPYTTTTIRRFFEHIGAYFILMRRAFTWPENWYVIRSRVIDEIDKLGVRSLGLVALMSTFVGAVITLQTVTNIDSPLIPLYTVGYATRESVILEFSSTMLCLILAGVVGSNVASEIGNMRVSEQIDALDIMGVNSARYLIMPKVVAAIIIFPFLILISMALGLLGGYLVSIGTGLITSHDYIYGLQYEFKFFHVIYSLVKTLFFAAIITSISSYQGYFVKGGALEVGAASTRGIVQSSVLILIVNYVLTQLMLI